MIALVSLATTAAFPSVALASNVSHPATYTGNTSTGGGTVELDVSADGSAVTRFAVTGLETPCGPLEPTTITESTPIVNDVFEHKVQIGLSFRGRFPAVQQAEGTLSFFFFRTSLSCETPRIPWTASTPTPPPDETPPNTKISSGPTGRTGKHKATFRFTSREAGSIFQCKLDGKKWANCKSPKTYKGLKDGKHVFKVKAIDAAGNVDPTPAKRSWRVD